jgi:glutathione S-transferase
MIIDKSGTPNGYKISILLEELGMTYDVHAISFQKGEQKVVSLESSPNKLGALVSEN